MILEFTITTSLGLVHNGLSILVSFGILVTHLCFERDIKSECHFYLERIDEPKPKTLPYSSDSSCQKPVSHKK
jgi:hypothetical protein